MIQIIFQYHSCIDVNASDVNQAHFSSHYDVSLRNLFVVPGKEMLRDKTLKHLASTQKHFEY